MIQPCARRAHRHTQTKQHSANVGSIYPIYNNHPRCCPPPTFTTPDTVESTFSNPVPKGHTDTPLTEQHSTIVGSIYPIQIYILDNFLFLTLCHGHTDTPPTEQHSTIVGSIYPIYNNHPRHSPSPTHITHIIENVNSPTLCPKSHFRKWVVNVRDGERRGW